MEVRRKRRRRRWKKQAGRKRAVNTLHVIRAWIVGSESWHVCARAWSPHLLLDVQNLQIPWHAVKRCGQERGQRGEERVKIASTRTSAPARIHMGRR